MPAWSGFLSAHIVGQINGLLKRAHRYGFTLDVISVEDIAESADRPSKLLKSTHSNHCLHFLLPLHANWIRYTLSALKVIRTSFHPTQLNYTDHLFLVIFFVQCIRFLIPLICLFLYYTVFYIFLFIHLHFHDVSLLELLYCSEFLGKNTVPINQY